jgi:predicted NodU family carbamoyl transferase
MLVLGLCGGIELEEIALHVVRFYQHETKQKNLCMAGGVVF